MDCDALVVGGGFYGCTIAAHLARQGQTVQLVEAGADLLGRASYSNQARVHQGYHYPRSLITGYRSRANYRRFSEAYADCTFRDFRAVYAIGREFSKVTAAQFDLFCRRIGAPIGPADPDLQQFFDPTTIEAVFAVEEMTFDAVKLRDRVAGELARASVQVHTRQRVHQISPLPGDRLRVKIHSDAGETVVRAGSVFNCTYSELNRIAMASGLPIVPLKHELAEMALVELPSSLAHIGVTVMCGPFFSLMPFPSTPWHTLSHVRYTPHAAWSDPHPEQLSAYQVFDRAPKQTAFERMRLDAARYLPAIAQARYVRSLWEVKTVLPANEADDGRPILFRPHAGLAHYHLVLGAKIDNVFDVLDQIDALTDTISPPRVA
ncbi:MAG: FAD-binding oxidoreductase [Bacteroidales bacterium]|nr:FAD-binding oxidoreductase [Bacteroidales bacterium]